MTRSKSGGCVTMYRDICLKHCLAVCVHVLFSVTYVEILRLQSLVLLSIVIPEKQFLQVGLCLVLCLER